MPRCSKDAAGMSKGVWLKALKDVAGVNEGLAGCGRNRQGHDLSALNTWRRWSTSSTPATAGLILHVLDRDCAAQQVAKVTDAEGLHTRNDSAASLTMKKEVMQQGMWRKGCQGKPKV
eukprot:1157951-Pelagomonas_calceolata.AAC.1